MAKRGRPTKYNESILDRTIEYYQNCLNATDKDGNTIAVVPWIEELALKLDIDDDTIVEWCKDEAKKEFSATIKKLMTLQQLRLSQLSLGKNVVGPIFLLKVNHGKNEKIIQENHNMDESNEHMNQIQDIIHAITSDAKSQHNQPN